MVRHRGVSFMSEYFYGWYFRCQRESGSLAVIPAVHLSPERRSCSVQIITREGGLYREFPISMFRINRKKGIMQIGENFFSRKGIRLRLEARRSAECGQETGGGDSGEKDVAVEGVLRFGKFSELGYDIMGSFARIPWMQCRHMVYSMGHSVNGEIKTGDERFCFKNGKGYMEGDSGTSFPDRYIWIQHFLPKGSLMFAAASIPLAGIHFTGTIGYLFTGSRMYRFATYLGAVVEKLEDGELAIRQGPYHVQIRFPNSGGTLLKAPESGEMVRKVRESIAGEAEYTLIYKKHVLLHLRTDKAATEYDVRNG